jgi:hypothetical protein
MSRRIASAALGVTMALGLCATIDVGVAAAKGPSAPVVAPGTVTCNVKAVVTFSPPLSAADTVDTSQVTLSAQLTKCVTDPAGKRTTVHVIGLAVGSIPTNTCDPTAINLTLPSGGNVRWTPATKVAPSTLSGGTVSGSVVTNANGKTQVGVSYAGGTVGGSFAGTASASLASNAPAATLSTACTSGPGVGGFTLKGSATL